MEKAGLIVEPEFNNPNYYLGEGTLTKQTELIRFIAKNNRKYRRRKSKNYARLS